MRHTVSFVESPVSNNQEYLVPQTSRLYDNRAITISSNNNRKYYYDC